MKKLTTIIAITFALISITALAKRSDSNRPLPRFEDYTVQVSEVAKPAEADLKSDPYAEMYKKHVLKAARKRPNFAGNYVVLPWDCGHNCKMFCIVNSMNGRVFIPPFSLSDWNGTAVEFKPDSKLLIVNGVINQTGQPATFYYLWDNEKLKLISSTGK